MAENRQYDHEYKVQAVKLAKEIGRLRLPKNWASPRIPCMAGCEQTVLEILILVLAHSPRKAL